MLATLSFGTWLKRERKKRRLSQAELGKLVAYSGEHIRKIEAGLRRCGQSQAELMAAAFDVPLECRGTFHSWATGKGTVDDETLLSLIAAFSDQNASPGNGLRPTAGQAYSGSLGCQGDQCNGLDPEMTGCADTSLTVEQLAIKDVARGKTVGTVELRFSRSCQTNWARLTRDCDEGRHLRAYLRDADGNIIDSTIVEAETSAIYVYTSMWYAPTGVVAVRACGVIEGCDEVCTNLY